MLLECKLHGLTEHKERVRNNRPSNSYQCRVCASEAVRRHRKTKRQKLVQEAGGKCALCGYDKYIGALAFHHTDPTLKEFGISGRGQTYSLERLRQEISKCILLCHNCHSEVEGGITRLS